MGHNYQSKIWCSGLDFRHAFPNNNSLIENYPYIVGSVLYVRDSDDAEVKYTLPRMDTASCIADIVETILSYYPNINIVELVAPFHKLVRWFPYIQNMNIRTENPVAKKFTFNEYVDNSHLHDVEYVYAKIKGFNDIRHTLIPLSESNSNMYQHRGCMLMLPPSMFKYLGTTIIITYNTGYPDYVITAHGSFHRDWLEYIYIYNECADDIVDVESTDTNTVLTPITIADVAAELVGKKFVKTDSVCSFNLFFEKSHWSLADGMNRKSSLD